MPGSTLQPRVSHELKLRARSTNLGTIEVSFLYHSIEMRLLEARLYARELLTAISDAERAAAARQVAR
jgi:hypothetical protein